MATLTVQAITANGLSPTYAAAAVGGDKVKPGPTTFVHVFNGDVTPITVTLATPGNYYGSVANPDLTVTVAASGNEMIPIPSTPFADPADSGLASISYSAVTSVTVAALRI